MASDSVEQTSHTIAWPGTTAYDESVRNLKLTPEAALHLLVESTTEHPERFVDKAPVILMGQDYVFAEPRKTEIRLQGFYVNGMTGRIEFRTSQKTIEKGVRDIPMNAFNDTTVVRVALDEGENPSGGISPTTTSPKVVETPRYLDIVLSDDPEERLVIHRADRFIVVARPGTKSVSPDATAARCSSIAARCSYKNRVRLPQSAIRR